MKRPFVMRLEVDLLAAAERRRQEMGERSIATYVAALIRKDCDRPSAKDLARAEVAGKLKNSRAGSTPGRHPLRDSRSRAFGSEKPLPALGDHPGSTPGGQVTVVNPGQCSKHKLPLPCRQCAS